MSKSTAPGKAPVCLPQMDLPLSNSGPPLVPIKRRDELTQALVELLTSAVRHRSASEEEAYEVGQADA